ncbi:unnamed protein product, partial [Polarella glacialis]
LLLRWRDLGSWGPPEAALMTLVILLAFDLMAFIMMIDHLWKINDLAMFVFIFLPPLVQPAAIVLGVVFLLTEVPAVGCIFGAMELFGTVNALFTLVVLAPEENPDALIFDFMALALIALVKAVLFSAANAHVMHLQAARDVEFMGTSDGEFLGRILATRSNGGEEEDEVEEESSIQGAHGDSDSSPERQNAFA